MSPTRTNQPTPPPVAATVHIYRGLMDSATTWRLRIDSPTNWAIVTSGTAVSFVLSDESHSHAVLLLVMLFTIMFLAIEARRTRYYDLWSSWLRLLEIEYFARVLQENRVTINDTWQELLVRDLGYPHFKSTSWQMLGRRLRDNYLAIYLFLTVSWIVKLWIHPASDTIPLIQSAAVGPFPGWLVFTIVIVYLVALILLMLVTYYGSEPSVEVLSHQRTLQKLVSPFQQPLHQRRAALDTIIATHADDEIEEED